MADPNTEQPTQAPETANPDPKPISLSESGTPVGEPTVSEATPVEPILTHEPIPTSAPDPVSVTENLPPVEPVETKVGTVPSALNHDMGNQFPAAIVDANRETATPTTETPGPTAEPTVVNPNQAAIDEATAQKNAILAGSLNDLTPADRIAMSEIDSKLVSLGAEKEPKPPYLGTPPGWDSEKPSIVSSQIPPTPVIPQNSERVVTPQHNTNERPIAASVAPRPEGILDKLRGLFGGRKPQTA